MKNRSLYPVRRIGPYQDLGPSDIPPSPAGVAMTGRDDGLLYWLSDNGSGAVSLVLFTSLPKSWGATIRGPTDGPLLASPMGVLRLYVTGAALSYELARGRSRNSQTARVLSRRAGHTANVYELTAADPFTFGDALTFTLVTT